MKRNVENIKIWIKCKLETICTYCANTWGVSINIKYIIILNNKSKI